MATLEKSGITIFDIDMSLKADSTTKDFKELYNEDAINQAIDIYLTNPYRIGQGTVNEVFSTLFADMTPGIEDEVIGVVQDSLARTFPEITVRNIIAESQPAQRRVYVKIEWYMTNYSVEGSYTRFWNLKD